MYKNYNLLRTGRDTRLKKGIWGDGNSLSSLSGKSAYPMWMIMLLTFLSVLSGQQLWAQAPATYGFSVSSEAYTPISIGDGATSPGDFADDTNRNLTDLAGFTVNGVTYTKYQMNDNGRLVLYTNTAPSTTATYTSLSSAITNAAVVIAPFGTDLYPSAVATSAYMYQQIGDELVFQWENVSRYSSTSTLSQNNDSLNFQIRLNVVTGEIKFVYGDFTLGNFPTGQPQVGFRTSTTWAADVNNLTLNITGSPLSCDWSNAVTGNINTATMYLGFANPDVIPQSGLTYVWTPQTTAPYVSPVRAFSAVSGITNNGATITWTAAANATQYEVQYRTVGSCDWTDWASNPVTGNTVALTGLTPGVSYQVRVKASAGSVSSIYSHIPNAAGSGSGYAATGTFTTEPLCQVPTGLTVSNVLMESATIQWNAPTNAPGLGYEYYFSEENTAPTGSGTPTTSLSATLDLSENTAYYVWVRSVCETGIESAWVALSPFRTLCAADAVPYALDIDAVTTPALPECVVVQNVNNDAKTWKTSASTTGITGKVMSYDYNSASVANDWFYLRGLSLTAGITYRLKFKYKDAYFAEKLKVAIGTSATNTAMTTSLFEVTTGTSSVVVPKEIDFAVTEDGVYFIGFQCYSNANMNILYVGEISVEEGPTCIKPVTASVDTITSESARLFWTASISSPSEGYEYFLSEANEAPTEGDAATGGVGAGILEKVIDGLAENTTYYTWVRAACGSGEVSEWTAAPSFRTSCTAVALPYVVDIESVTVPELPGCTAIQNVNNDNRTWRSYASTANITGKVMGYPYGANAANDWFYTNGVILTAGVSYRLKFKYKDTGYVEKLKVAIGESAVNTAMTAELFNVTTGTSTTTVPKEIDFTVAEDGVYVIGFQCYSAANMNVLYLGEISLDLTPSCLAIPTLSVDTVTSGSARLFWSASPSTPSEGYEYFLSETNEAPTEGDSATGSVDAGVLEKTLTGLAENTTYYVWVRSACGSEEVSEWKAVSFKTSCTAVDIPYAVDIDAVTVPALPDCTSIQNVNNDARVWRSYASTDGITGKVMGYPYIGANGANDWFFTNGVNLTAGVSYRLKFKYKDTGYVEKLKVAIGGSAINTAMTAELFNVTTGTLNTTVPKEIDFTVAEDGVYVIGFQCYSDANMNVLYLGEISIDLSPPCVAVASVSVDAVGSDSARLFWPASLSNPSEGYEYFLSETNEAPLEGDAATGSVGAGILEKVIDGLDENTTYYTWVRAVCGAGEFSEWKAAQSFKTACTAVDIPYVMDINSAVVPALPGCTSVQNVNGDGYTWRSYASTDGITGKVMGYPYNWQTPANDWFFTNGLSLTAGVAYRLTFKYKDTGYAEKLRVSIGNSALSTAMATELFNVTTGTDDEAILKHIDFTVATDGVYTIGFEAYSVANMNILYLGEISVDFSPPCVGVNSVSVDSVTSETARLFWPASASNPSEGYEYFLGQTNTAPLESDPATGDVDAGILEKVLTGLTDSTTYYAWVRSVCGSGEMSAWTAAPSFTTLCNAGTVPYVLDIDAVTVPALPVCLQVENVNNDNKTWVTVAAEAGPGTINEKSLMYPWHGSNAANDWFYLKGLSLTAGTNYELKFTYSDYGFEEMLRVSIGNSPTAGSMTTELIDITTLEDSEAHDETVPFTVAADGVYYIGFQAHSDADMFNLYVGKISVDVALSTPGFDLSKLSYYPNPVQDVLTLNHADAIDAVEVFNILGQKVYQKDFASTEAKVDMAKLPAGTYIVNVVSKGLTKNIKVIKK